MERIRIGQGQMSYLVISQLKIDTYVHYWTYLDEIDDSDKTACRGRQGKRQ